MLYWVKTWVSESRMIPHIFYDLIIIKINTHLLRDVYNTNLYTLLKLNDIQYDMITKRRNKMFMISA